MVNLGGITPEQFLKEYWQKKPLLIRQAFPGYQCPVSADELAGLSCEEGVESRIVREDDGGKPWQVKSGPFAEDHFSTLPPTHWTLLVQGLDYWVPEVSDLLEQFRFIPNWRIDDIMASYAPDQGSVGPHFDHYDVFLLQAEGRRTWRVGPLCSGQEPRIENTPLRILKDFDTQEEWVLEPGDMLYLPPLYAHYGVAQGACITFSIGFRSPSHQEMLSSWADFAFDQIKDEVHLDDPNLQPQKNPGQITPKVLDEVEQILTSHVQRRRMLAEWFGRFTSEAKHLGIVEPPEQPLKPAELGDALEQGAPLRRNEGSRFSFTEVDDTFLFFADGDCHELSGKACELAQHLCQTNQYELDDLRDALTDHPSLNLLTRLFNEGSLYLEGESFENEGADDEDFEDEDQDWLDEEQE